jgi:hypothetical protein
MIIHYDHMSSKTHIHHLLLSNPVPTAKGVCLRKKVIAKQDTPSDPIHQAKSLHRTRIARRKRLRAVVVALVWNLLLPLTELRNVDQYFGAYCKQGRKDP